MQKNTKIVLKLFTKLSLQGERFLFKHILKLLILFKTNDNLKKYQSHPKTKGPSLLKHEALQNNIKREFGKGRSENDENKTLLL